MATCDVSGQDGAELMTVVWRGQTWNVYVAESVAERVMDIARWGKLEGAGLKGWDEFAAKFDPNE